MRTASGFEFEISSGALDNWELLEDLVDLETSSAKIVPVCRRLLGKEGTQRLKEHCRDENGKVSIVAMQNEIGEIFTLLGEDNDTKN